MMMMMMKMIGKKSKFWGSSEKNSERWSWGDGKRQPVSKAASSHRKRTITNSGQPCTSDHQLRGWRRPETAAVGVGGALGVVRKILIYFRFCIDQPAWDLYKREVLCCKKYARTCSFSRCRSAEPPFFGANAKVIRIYRLYKRAESWNHNSK